MKLCKDCKHCEPDVSFFLWVKIKSKTKFYCINPENISKVSGLIQPSNCEIQRSLSLLCGEDGKYWEAK